ncbi:N-acetylmannosamine-6-phosphate 2-epimerase [Candidatus Mycoplasma pogonae]
MKIPKNTFIVSCQALENEPMFGKKVVQKMAKAVLQGGAQGLRTSQVNNIRDLMSLDLQVPLISIIKKNYPNSDVFITATLKELKKLMALGQHVIAIDATLRERPKENLKQMVQYFKKHKQKGQYLMADCSNEADVLNAIKLKFDYIGTTLRGYTADTKGKSNFENDFAFIKWAKKQCQEAKIPLIAEGGIDTPLMVKQAFKAGADIVVVGSAITRPQYITKMFVDIINDKTH